MGVHICKATQEPRHGSRRFANQFITAVATGGGTGGLGQEGRIIIFTLHILSYLLKFIKLESQQIHWDKN